MREITEATRDAIYGRVKDGDTRYFWRATVETAHMKWYDYDTENAPGGDYDNDRPRTGHYSSMIFGTVDGHGGHVREIPSIKSGQITRDLDQDIAEITLTLLNTTISPMGDTEDEYTGSEEYDVPGALSYSRGRPTIEVNRWGHNDTGYEGYIAPDRLMRTYEGYGIDREVPAGHDPNMYATGIWLIDSVALNSVGDVVIKGRDLGRLLLDHIAMPPNIPWDSYPMAWSKIRSEEVPGRTVTGGSWSFPAGDPRSSNEKYIGRGIVDDPTYVNGIGGVLGHNAGDVNGAGYWLSTGQESQDSFVWWEIDLDSSTCVSGIRLTTFGGPFVVYISLHDGDDWIGKKKIPYKVTTEDVDLNADIKFVHVERFERSTREDIVLKRRYKNVTKVRITMTRLKRRPGANHYPWRAGLTSFHAYTGSHDAMGFDHGTNLKAVGNYRDYTHIIRWICAWSGFWWPERDAARTICYGRSDAYDVVYDYEGQSAFLTRGRVWGTFQATGTAGIADLKADLFDKQPLMDAIQVVRNIVGFNFFIDEVGGAIWRMPNLYASGNYLTPSHLDNEGGRRTSYVPGAHEVLDENTILRQYNTTLDSKNLRERIAIANSNGRFGSVIHGYRPYRTGMRRISVWTDQHFESNRECRVAADMVAAQQMFSFRKSTSVIPPHPGIQIDDQVRIYERITNETFFHYVTGIATTYDADTNKGEYTLTTHWLGERLSDAWVVRVDQLDHFTQAFLNNLGVDED